MIGLFCKRALLKRWYSAKETYHFMEPTNRSHPIVLTEALLVCYSWALSGPRVFKFTYATTTRKTEDTDTNPATHSCYRHKLSHYVNMSALAPTAGSLIRLGPTNFQSKHKTKQNSLDPQHLSCCMKPRTRSLPSTPVESDEMYLKVWITAGALSSCFHLEQPKYLRLHQHSSAALETPTPMWVRVLVCACACACVCMCKTQRDCVCVRERKWKEQEKRTVCVCACVCVCVWV